MARRVLTRFRLRYLASLLVAKGEAEIYETYNARTYRVFRCFWTLGQQ